MSFLNKPLSFALGVVAFSVNSWVNAQAGHAHIHGVASMDLVMEGDKVFVEFGSPMASIVGFEYKPETRVEKVKVKDAITALKSDNLFNFEGASCRLQSIESELPWEEDEDHSHDHDEHDHDEHEHDKHEHDEHDHDEHEHDEHEHDEHEHDEHEHDEREHDKHERENDSESHSDIALGYRFSCKGNLKALKLGHFEQFPLMDTIKVQWIGKSGQGAESLSKSKNTISF